MRDKSSIFCCNKDKKYILNKKINNKINNKKINKKTNKLNFTDTTTFLLLKLFLLASLL